MFSRVFAKVPRVSDEKSSKEDDLDQIEKNIDALDSEAAKASADRIAAENAEKAAPSETASESDDEEEEGEDEDAANVAALARRVAALGAEDESEALAREEERKLAERRASKKKGAKKKGGGLEAAASKKLAKIGTRAEPKRAVAVASDADPLIERTTKISDWAKQNQKAVQLVGALLTVALLGVAGFLYYDHKKETDASVVLTKAIDVQRAKIGEPKKDDEEEDHDQYFKTYEDRRIAALKSYREVESKYPGTGAAILARLAEGSLLLDGKDADGALAAYTEVKGSALAAADTEVKGRALEGTGFAYELKAIATPADKDKNLDAALAAFKELENAADVKGFKELAMYHQARVLMNKGDKAKAKEVLLSLKERLSKADEPLATGLPAPPTYPYLKEVALDRLREIDPESAPKAPKGGGHGGANGMSEEQIQKLIEQMKKQQGGGK